MLKGRIMMSSTKKMVVSGLFVALALVLPTAFHAIPNAGRVMLPMHIPVLLCGFVCGPLFGLLCGIISPLLSSAITGMPPVAMLPSMMCELAVYGLVSGLIFNKVKISNNPARIYIALITAMLCGRFVNGVLNSLIFQAGSYSLQAWISASFTVALPGIVTQLVAIPLVIVALKRAKLIEYGDIAEAKKQGV